MSSSRIDPRYCWRCPEVVRLDLDRGWESLGFSTRLSRTVSLRDSRGNRRPKAWRPEQMGELLVGLDDLLFLGRTDSQLIRIPDIVHWDLQSGATDWRGRPTPDTQQIVIHRDSGGPVSLAWGGTAIGTMLTDVLGRAGKLYELTLAFVDGPERRASLAERLPPQAERPLPSLSHEDLIELDDFWGGEARESLDEMTAVDLSGRTRPDLSFRLQLVREYDEGVCAQVVLLDEEIQRRTGDPAFVRVRNASQDRALDALLARIPGTISTRVDSPDQR